jgi:hypothetical protein
VVGYYVVGGDEDEPASGDELLMRTSDAVAQRFMASVFGGF